MVAKHSTALSTINLASWVVEMIKNLPEVQETWVQSLGWEDPLEKGMATHSSILAWRSSWTEDPGRLQSIGSQMPMCQKCLRQYQQLAKNIIY